MALSTYLQIVNEVLVRMREPQVTTVTENTISSIIGKFVNDAKRQICDAYDWDAFNQSIVVPTVVGQVGNYSLTGAGVRFKIMDVVNTTVYTMLENLSHADHDRLYYTMPNPTQSVCVYYTFQGVDSNGDAIVKFWPVPDRVYSIRFSVVIPENDFSSDSDTTKLAKEPIVLGALARALVERGEDGGLSSSEAYALYRSSLADLISLELARSPENDSFIAT